MDQANSPRRQANAGSFKAGASGNPGGKRKPAERRDGWINEASGHGTTRDRRTLTRYGLDVVTDLEAMQLWRSEWLCASIIETKPKEIFRPGYNISLGDKKKAQAVEAAAEELGLDEAISLALMYERAYGGAAILPILEGALGEWSEPLPEDRILKVVAYHVLEPRELRPLSYYPTLEDRKFRQPQTYQFMPLTTGRVGHLGWVEIHESRLIIFPGIRVSKQTQPGQREGWGDSVLSRPHRLIADYGMTWGSVATILHNFGRDVLHLDGWAELASQAGNDDVMGRRMASLDMASSALRLTVLDAKDKFASRGGQSLSGLDSVLIQQAQVVAASAGYPVTVLLGMSPGGLNATGDMDLRNWYASIENDARTRVRPRLERALKFLMLASDGPLKGTEPEVWSVTFGSMWSPSEKEDAETRKLTAETDKINVEIGAASADDIAKSRFGGDTYSAETVIDWKAREAQKKIDEERAESLDAAAVAAMGRAPDPAAKPGEDVDEEQAEGEPVKPRTQATREDEDGPGIARTFAGLDVVIENKRGSKRTWIGPDGVEGSTKMRFDYGYIRGAPGADGDSVDVYLGPTKTPEWVYVIHQQCAPSFTEYDEDKVMVGFDSPNHARDAYLAQYDDDRFYGGMSVMSLDEFVSRMNDGGKITTADRG